MCRPDKWAHTQVRPYKYFGDYYWHMILGRPVAAEIGLPNLGMVPEFPGSAGQDHLAGLQDIRPVGHFQSQAGVLLHQ